MMMMMMIMSMIDKNINQKTDIIESLDRHAIGRSVLILLIGNKTPIKLHHNAIIGDFYYVIAQNLFFIMNNDTELACGPPES